MTHVTLYTIDHGRQAVEARIVLDDGGQIQVTSRRAGHAATLLALWQQWGIRAEDGSRAFPRDGERFLAALPREYRGHYRWATEPAP